MHHPVQALHCTAPTRPSAQHGARLRSQGLDLLGRYRPAGQTLQDATAQQLSSRCNSKHCYSQAAYQASSQESPQLQATHDFGLPKATACPELLCGTLLTMPGRQPELLTMSGRQPRLTSMSSEQSHQDLWLHQRCWGSASCLTPSHKL